MRLGWPIVIATIFASTPAMADITATYRVSDGRMPDMIIRVTDDGDSRLTSGSQMAVLTVNGETYVIMSDLNGVFAVRQADMVAAFADLLPADFRNDVEQTEIPSPSYEIVESGTEMVGGREGTVLAVRQDAEEPEITERYVINRDSDLAPIGTALARQFAGSMEGFRGVQVLQNYGAHILDIFSRGTVIRLGNLFRLESIDTNPIPRSELALPDTVLTREEFVARMGWPERL